MYLLISVSPQANVKNSEEIWPCDIELMYIKIKNAQLLVYTDPNAKLYQNPFSSFIFISSSPST